MRIEKTALDAQNRCVYSLYKEKGCIGHAVTCADCFEALEIAPEWQSRGYGSYLLREVLRQNGGFDRTAPSEFTAPLPDAGNTAAQALAAKFGFVPRGGLLVRRREEGVTLRKTRWCMLYAGRVLEIDVYPFWEHTAVLEIELPDEGAPVSIPPQIRVLREVTADRRLKNAVLAQRIPDERELLAETSEN